MEDVRGPIRIVDILRHRDNWREYLAWKKARGESVRFAVFYHVGRALLCRTPALGVTLYRCHDCGTFRVVPHSCKSPFCSSCGSARTDQWCRQLLSDLLPVPYRHLIFTIPLQLRLLIKDNRKRLQQVLFRAMADSILALAGAGALPMSRKARKRLRRKVKKFLPGFQASLHTFGSNIKWNPHIHVMVTAGGLSIDGKRWIDAPAKSLVSAPELATEWRLRVIKYITREHSKQPLKCRRLRCDRRRRINVGKLLGYIYRMKWHVCIGPSLEDPTNAVGYCARYTRRPALGETRIEKYDGQYVTFRYKDYYRDGKRSYWKCPVLEFIDRLVQHIPEKGARHFRNYGLFAPRCKTKLMKQARKHLKQKRKRRLSALTWEQLRKLAGEKRPLSCPDCKGQMTYECHLFGSPAAIASFLGVEPKARIPYPLYVRGPAAKAVS